MSLTSMNMTMYHITMDISRMDFLLGSLLYNKDSLVGRSLMNILPHSHEDNRMGDVFIPLTGLKPLSKLPSQFWVIETTN